MLPVWSLKNLRQKDPVSIEIYAASQLGRSQKVVISDIDLRQPERYQTSRIDSNRHDIGSPQYFVAGSDGIFGQDWMLAFTSILGLILVLIVACLIVLIHRRKV
jgi:hypothetical protein